MHENMGNGNNNRFITRSLRDDYNASISGVKNLLVRHSKPNHLLFVGELINGMDFKAKMVGSIFFMFTSTWNITYFCLLFLLTGSFTVFPSGYAGSRCALWHATGSHASGRGPLIHLLPNLCSASYSLST